MDCTLNSLWSSGKKPFHGETIYPADEVFVRDAIVAIPSALDHIAQHYPDCPLFSLDDWHEHDGFVTSAESTTIKALSAELSTPESYVSFHSDECAVYRAVYPETLDFVLRYSLWVADDENQPLADREVHWTFTGCGHDIAELKKRWASYHLVAEPSVKYFQSRYAG